MIRRIVSPALMPKYSMISRLKNIDFAVRVVHKTCLCATISDAPLTLYTLKNAAVRMSSSSSSGLPNQTETTSTVDDVSAGNSVGDIHTPTSSTVKSKRDQYWDSMLHQLILYREENGNTMVPKSYEKNPQLGTWVDTQRHNFKYYAQGKKSLLSEKRINILEREGMVWDVHELNWDARFQELVSYKNKHDDLCPPQNDEYSELYTWVFVQRRMYSMKLAGKPNSMTENRIKALESIGFVFSVHEELWNQRFAELKQYRRDFGDCMVPKIFANKVLAKWVGIQRSQYKYLQDGRVSHLTQERIDQLEEIGFVWNVHTFKWNSRLQELQSFFAVNGHTKIKSKKPLATWTRRQRSEYKKYIEGKKSNLDEERISQLKRAGLQLESN